jgi:hypothetical protein
MFVCQCRYDAFVPEMFMCVYVSVNLTLLVYMCFVFICVSLYVFPSAREDPPLTHLPPSILPFDRAGPYRTFTNILTRLTICTEQFSSELLLQSKELAREM